MTVDLRQELARLAGRIAIVGIGNTERGDDGFGVRLAEAARESGHADVIIGGTVPEQWIGRITSAGYDHVLLVDAVDMAAESGAVVLMNADDIVTRFPQVSTHKFSLGALAHLIRLQSPAQVWLLGVQPESLGPSSELTARLQASLDALSLLLNETLAQNRRPDLQS